MSQTDDIHDSFYDLFNQHFRRIDDPDPKEEPRFYANVAIGSHSKPCRVHKDFQCVVIVSKSEPRSSTPPPFLNRFEKYSISHKDFLDARLQSLPPCLRVAVQCALEKVCSDCSTVMFTVKRNCSGYIVSMISAGRQSTLGNIDIVIGVMYSDRFKCLLSFSCILHACKYLWNAMESHMYSLPTTVSNV